MSYENLRLWADPEEQPETKSRGRKERLYKSKFDPKATPSYSTFGKNRPTEIPKDMLPVKKPAVPSAKVQGKCGLVSSKNFVVSNAVEVILASNKLKKGSSKSRSVNQQQDVRYVNKKDYGKTPAYLSKVKEDIETEKAILQEYIDDMFTTENGVPMESIPEADREELIKQLKRKWGAINKKYQVCMGGSSSNSKIRLKEKYEKDLKQIEDDIKLLSRGSIKVVLE